MMLDSAPSSHQTLLKLLDLEEWIEKFYTFFARKKDFLIQGNYLAHKKIIDELEVIQIPPMPKIPHLDTQILHLKKFGTLHKEDIYYFLQIVGYFHRLKKHQHIISQPTLHQMLEKILIPESLLSLIDIFDDDKNFKEGIYKELDNLNRAISHTTKQIQSELANLLSLSGLQEFLVDKQIHLINNTQTLLLKAGYTRVIKGSVLMRSQSGFFYLLPQNIQNLYQKQKDLEDEHSSQMYKICAELSEILRKHILFLQFINKEFDYFDSLQARVAFAKQFDLEFVLPTKNTQNIILHGFSHPILERPKPIYIDFTQQLLLITGVNAGGKTMLLKSILSSVFLAKYLLPMKINPHKSQIPHFKHIRAIINDPQSTKNDISTFAGRMLEFSQILGVKDLLLGVDEIELGTDADEAASLYKALLESLLNNNAKVIITTHHKRLASLMASDSRVQMSAAIYDVQQAKPTFEFMHGSIGKSYAFETAKRYGISKSIIARAMEHYGEDKERLNHLIERSAQLEIQLKNKHKELEETIKQYERKKLEYAHLGQELKAKYQQKSHHLEQTYQDALSSLKTQAKTINQIHRNMNNANKILSTLKSSESFAPKEQTKELGIGDMVKYNVQRGVIVSVNAHNCLVELDSGMRLKVNKNVLQLCNGNHSGLDRFDNSGLDNRKLDNGGLDNELHSRNKASLESSKLIKDSKDSIWRKSKKFGGGAIIDSHIDSIVDSRGDSRGGSSGRFMAHITYPKVKNAHVSLDLHGLRAEEALERLDKFLSDCLMAGFDEVLICHGIGTGRLSKVVSDFLKSHPKVIHFDDAPINMGGMGAKIVRL